MGLAKRTFYPDPEIEARLVEAPSKKLSQYINALIRKGLAAEEREEIAELYRSYDEALSQAVCSKQDQTNDRMAVESLFALEDEVVDWHEHDQTR
jgi:hypothetical protein